MTTQEVVLCIAVMIVGLVSNWIILHHLDK
jgi:hypothetical protein